MRRRASSTAAAALLGGLALAGCGGSAHSTSSATPRPPAPAPAAAASVAASTPAASLPGAPCGPAGAAVLAQTAGLVAMRIYAGELGGAETLADQSQVEHYAPLLSALARDERAAASQAVSSLVFSHTHLVRLRVIKRSVVLADVGGPYVLAPVWGTLRFKGRSVGRYALSVQDDLGYVKLVTRFIGAPLVMRMDSIAVPVEGLVPGPTRIPKLGPVLYRGASNEAFSFDARSFPRGRLRISLLLGVDPSLAAKTCAQIKTAELGVVAERVARRFTLSPTSFSAYLKLTNSLTGALLYIRSGSRQLAPSSTPGPRRLPSAGAVSYRGSSYEVSSFEAPTTVGPARIYQLVAP